MKKLACTMLLGWLILAITTGAQSPYAGEESRAIKSLSASEIQALRQGHGMGYAKAAELNHYPGPRHVLDRRMHAGEGEDGEQHQADAPQTGRHGEISAVDGLDQGIHAAGGGILHIGLVSDRAAACGVPLVIHNIGAGTREEDILFRYGIIGHYRLGEAP